MSQLIVKNGIPMIATLSNILTGNLASMVPSNGRIIVIKEDNTDNNGDDSPKLYNRYIIGDGSTTCANLTIHTFESDPVFSASPAANITSSNISTWNSKQDSLVSGTNIKTVNNNSLIGSGNVQVGDITGVELEGEIEDLESTLLTDALRKSLQSLLPSEKTQVLTNLGISDVATESNLKTVNGASLVGTGNIEIASTNVGNVTIMLGPGDSQTSIMSQKAVSDYARKVTQSDLNGTSDWIKSKLEEKGWVFNARLVYSLYTSDTTKCVTPMLNISVDNQEKLTIYHGTTADYGMIIIYNEDNSVANNTYESGTNVMSNYTSNSTTPKLRFTIGIDKIAQSYIYSDTKKKYLFKGDEYLYSVIAESAVIMPFDLFYNNILTQEFGISNAKLISQKAITEKFDSIVYDSKRPTYFKGAFSKFDIADYPLFDIRECDGISVLVEWDLRPTNRFSMVEMMTSNQNNNQLFFSLTNQYGNNFKAGLISAYFNTVDMGCSLTTSVKYNHLVMTFDFKKGIMKIYFNGVLNNTIQASDYSYETLMTYLNQCTKLGFAGGSNNAVNKTLGLAVFGSVLTDADVTTLFGGGCEELRTELLPQSYEANSIVPHYYNCGLVTYNNGSTNGADISGTTITIKNGCTGMYLGLTGINESDLYGNCIYEFDIEVLSGTGTTYDRGMIYCNNYYKCYTITDENGNDVSYNTQIGVGLYHIVSRPDNTLGGRYNSSSLQLNYVFSNCSSDFSIYVHPQIKLVERGAAIVFTPKTYKGAYWQQRNGYKLPTTGYLYDGCNDVVPYYDVYKNSTVKYVSSTPPLFNGQMAVDSANGKIYAGYLTSSGGTWKQISN